MDPLKAPPAAADLSADFSPHPACPICGCARGKSVRHLTWTQLKKAWNALGIHFSEASLPVADSPEGLHVWRCGQCGFEYSDLGLAGNASFYQELQAQLPNYYPPNAFEYERAIRFARERGLREVLDVGCGSGNFLNLAKAQGLDTYGVELNPTAAELARRAGHKVHEQLLSELLRQTSPPKYDFVTAWQVLEHVSDPVGFLSECSRVMKPKGYLGVAVPLEGGIHQLCPYDPHLWPPHHVTRWRLADLKAAGARAGLRLVSGGGDPIYGDAARHFWELHNRLAPVLGIKSRPGGDRLPAILSFIYRKTGARHFFPRLGGSVFAFYSLSDSRAQKP